MGLDAVLVNTAGGIACGDRFAVAIEAQAGASVTRRDACRREGLSLRRAGAELAVELTLGAGARLDWLPQETILFDQARLVRRLDVEHAGGCAR